MPDNLIIAPDGLVKVEPARCLAFCGTGGGMRRPGALRVLRLGVASPAKAEPGTPKAEHGP